jgi:hypothetical protein
MTRLKAILTLAILGTSTVAIAEPTFRGGISINLGTPQPVVRTTPPPRHYVRFDDRDARYDGDERERVNQDISGVYDSQYGRVTLTQQGSRIFGTYENNAGPAVIKGRLRDGAVYFRWRQGDKEGRGVFTLNGRRTPTLAGTWGVFDSRTNGGRWTLHPVRVGYRDHNRGYGRR